MFRYSGDIKGEKSHAHVAAEDSRKSPLTEAISLRLSRNFPKRVCVVEHNRVSFDGLGRRREAASMQVLIMISHHPSHLPYGH
jgi:hypothetical protein